MLIAHNLRGEAFGPAQKLHGATYVVDATLRRADLDGDGIVVDIGRATAQLPAVLSELSYHRLAVTLHEPHVASATYEHPL